MIYKLCKMMCYDLLKNVRITDRVSRIDLHKHAKLISLEQRREKQLYSLMHKLAKKEKARKIMNRNTSKAKKKK